MRSLLVLLLTLPLLLSAAACGRGEEPPPAAEELLRAMQGVMSRTAQVLPEGLLYRRGASPDAPDYLTDTLFTALYGRAAEGLLEGDGEGGTASLGDAALFLSVAPYPCELAVFRCTDVDAIPTVVSLCHSRVDTVLRGFEGSPAENAATGLVTVKGCFVLLIIAEDPQAVAEGLGDDSGRPIVEGSLPP